MITPHHKPVDDSRPMTPVARAVWLLIAVATFALFGYRAWVTPGGTDAEAYYNAGLRAAAGAPFYFPGEHTPFKYLPPIAYLFIPLSWIPLIWARMVVFLVSWLIGAKLYLSVIRRWGATTGLFVFVAMARFHNHDFLNLQINHWVLGLLVYYLLTRTTRPWMSATAFALMAMFKVTPLVLLAPLVALGRLGELTRIAILIGLLALIPIVVHPDHGRLYLDWYALVRETTPWPAPDFPVVQSIQAAAWYWLRGVLEPGSFASLMTAVFVGSLVALSTTVRSGADRTDPGAALLALCAAAPLAVIFSPLAWKHVYLFIWPAIVAIVVQKRWKTYACVLATMSLGPGLIALVSRDVADRSYLTVAGATVLCVSVLAALQSTSRRS